MEQIKYDDFAKVDLRLGTILEAAIHPSADKLLVLKVDLGEETPRQIVAGIRASHDPATLPGKQIVVVANLEPRALRGVESRGMLLAFTDESGLSLVTTERSIKPGSQAK